MCNPRPSKDDKNSFSYDDGEGFIKYNRKTNILTMIITEYNWAKDFSVLYDKNENTVELKVLKDNPAALEEFKTKKVKRSNSQTEILNGRQ